MPGGLTWGLNNKAAQAPEGWREDLLEFNKYGGPGTSYEGKGKLTTRLKDVICAYFYMLGVDPNVHAEEIPEGYMEKNLDDLGVTTPPEGFVAPDWAGGPDGNGGEDHVHEDQVHVPEDHVPDGNGEEDHVPEHQVHVPEDHVSERPSTSNREQAKRKRAGDVSDSESESDEERREENRPRIVLHIRKSLMGEPSKPPKKKSKTKIDKCHKCGEGLSSLDRKSKNLFVPCRDHRVHKYCQEECMEDH